MNRAVEHHEVVAAIECQASRVDQGSNHIN